MTERLTDISKREKYGIVVLLKPKEAGEKLAQLEDIIEKYNIENIDELNKRLEDIEHYAYDTNRKFVDIMDKYGIERVEELDSIVNNGLAIIEIQKINILEKRELQHDRDTWKKVAHKEADILRDINYKLYNEDRIDFETYFYQQAQKEGKSND